MSNELAVLESLAAHVEPPGPFIRCQGVLKHAWDLYDSTWTPQFGIPVTLRCERCGTERRESYDRHGTMLNRHYHYPPGYKYAKGQRPSLPEFRVMLLVQRIQEARRNR